jgi:hypothetical protein
MERSLTCITLLAIALLLVIQKDVEGGLVVNGWAGVGAAAILCCLLAIVLAFIGLLKGDSE